MATELLFSDLKAWLDAQPENTAGTPYEIIIKNASSSDYTKAITRYVSIVGMEMKAGVNKIGYQAFLNCEKLVGITIPNGVTTIEPQAFQGCKSLWTVTIPVGLTSINNMVFSGCSNLKYINIPYGVTSIGSFAFSNCSNLDFIELPATLTSLGDRAFNYCTSMSFVYVYVPFSETLMQPESFIGTTSNLRLLIYPSILSGWQSATLTNYGLAPGVRAESLYTKWVRVA